MLVGSELGSSDGSFYGSNGGKTVGLLLDESLEYNDVPLLDLSEIDRDVTYVVRWSVGIVVVSGLGSYVSGAPLKDVEMDILVVRSMEQREDVTVHIKIDSSLNWMLLEK